MDSIFYSKTKRQTKESLRRLMRPKNQTPNDPNTSEHQRNRGMDINQLKQRIDASGKKLVTLGNEYIKSKDEIAARKVLVKMFVEISQQTLLLGEQNAQMDRNQRGMK